MTFGAPFNVRTRPVGTVAQPSAAPPMLVLPIPAEDAATPWMDQYLVRGVKNRYLAGGGVALLLVVLYFMRRR